MNLKFVAVDTNLDPYPRDAPVLYWYKTVRNPKAPGGAELIPHLIDTHSGVGSDVLAVDLNKDGIIDVVDTTIKSCFKDNTYTFKSDSTGIADNGPTKCNPTDPQTTPFTWSFGGTNQSTIKSDADPLLASGLNIFSLTSTKIVLYKDTTVFGASIWYVVDLKH